MKINSNSFIGIILVVTYFWVPAQKIKKIKKIKKNIIKKYNSEKKGCQNAQKIVKNWLRRYKNTKIKILTVFVD